MPEQRKMEWQAPRVVPLGNTATADKSPFDSEGSVVFTGPPILLGPES